MALLHLAKERRTEQEQDPDNQRIEANFPPEIKKVLAACPSRGNGLSSSALYMADNLPSRQGRYPQRSDHEKYLRGV